MPKTNEAADTDLKVIEKLMKHSSKQWDKGRKSCYFKLYGLTDEEIRVVASENNKD
ncbi:MAG: hypothetical protein HY096_07555 [Nitrospinae bacterium]|nr:hypothetical protein [Nitrospinota bacterium]